VSIPESILRAEQRESPELLDLYRADVPRRISDVERASRGTLPSRMTLALAQTQWNAQDLTRAAKLLSRRFDLDPSFLFEPYRASVVSSRTGVASLHTGLYTDPVTGGPITLETARRFYPIDETRMVRRVLRSILTEAEPPPSAATGHGVGTTGMMVVDPARVAKVLRAFAPVRGERFELVQAMGAALDIARSDVELALLRENLEYTARLPGLTPQLQVAAAHQAALRGREVRTLGDVATALDPRLGEVLKMHEETISRPVFAGTGELQAVKPRTEEISPAQLALESAQQTSYVDPSQIRGIEAQQRFAETVLSGLASPGDWLSVLEDAQSDYIKAGKEIAERAELPFTDTFVGRSVGTTLDLLSRGVGAIERVVFGEVVDAFGDIGRHTRALVDPSYHLTDEPDLPRIAEALRDSRDIILGRTNVYTELHEDAGVPMWATAVADLILGGKVDPLMWGLRWRSGVKASHLISGRVGTASSAEYISRVNQFLDQPARRIGDLKDVTIAQYLRREADRARRPEAMFDRAVNNYRRWFGVGSGIDAATASRVWEFNRTARKLGLSGEQRDAAIRGLLATAMGVRPKAGTFAEDILELDRVLRVQRTEALHRTFATTMGVPASATAAAQRRTREAGQALQVLDDAAADFAGGVVRMLEIPHIAGGRLTGASLARFNNWLRTTEFAGTDIGRTIRALPQTNPRRYGSRIVFEIEDADVVRDFERALIRSKVASPDEIARAKTQFAAAVDRRNPTRETDFKRVVGEWNARIRERKNAKYGIDAALSARIVQHLQKIYGGGTGGRRQTFAAFAGTEAERIRIRGLRRALRGAGREEREALEQAIRDAEAGITSVTSEFQPFLRSQFDNTYEMLDPVLYELGIAEIMGTLRKWTRAQRVTLGNLGNVPELERALKAAKAANNDAEVARLTEAIASARSAKAILPIRRGVDRAADLLISQAFLAVWKPLAVLRPAYILRVVGIEEQSRFLATVGLMRRLQTGKRSGPLLARLGMNEPQRLPVGFKLPEAPGQRGQELEDAILFLNDRTHRGIIDDIGFNPDHQDRGGALADVILTGGAWDDQMRQAALTIATTYPRQLAAIGIDAGKLRVRGDAAKNATQALEAQRRIDEGIMTFALPGIPNEQLVNAGAAASHVLTQSDDALRRVFGQLRPGRWDAIGRDADNFDDYWWHVLVHQYGTDPMGNRILGSVGRGRDTEDIVDDIMRWLKDTRGEGPSYAKGLLHGAEEVTDDLLEFEVRRAAAYAEDITAGHSELASAAAVNQLDISVLRAIPQGEKPLFVHGPEMAEFFTGQVGPFKRARDIMGRLILQTPTNTLSRQPYFKHWYDVTYRSLVENAREMGWSAEQIQRGLPGFRETARQQGISQVRRIMFDFSRTGRFEEMTRFGLVFVQPFLEFPLVWSRIIRQRPEVLGHALRLGRNAMQSGFVKRDPETGELVIPLSWWAGAAPLLAAFTGGRLKPGAGGGWELMANLSSFNLFAQGAFPVNLGGFAGTEFPIPVPSLAPPFQMAMQNWLASSNVNARLKARVESWLFQFGDINVVQPEALLPAWLRYGIETAFPDTARNTADFNATHFLQLQEAMGLEPNPELARRQSRKLAAARMFFAWVFPAAPKVEFPTVDLEREYRSLIELHGPLEGRTRFMATHEDLRLMTIARTFWDADDPNDPLASPVPIPANRAVAELLSTKGAREFAQLHPEWVWAIIPRELYEEGKFDPGIFFSQIAAGLRHVRSPEEFIAEGERQSGWDAFFTEDARYRALVDALAQQRIGEGDPGYDELKNDHDAALKEIRDLYPAWRTDFDSHSSEQVESRVMAIARELAKDKLFSKTEVGQWLRGFLPLFDLTRDRLSEANLRTLESKTAERLGIVADWEKGLKILGLAFPQGEQAYRLFFDRALKAGVRTVGDRLLDAIPEAAYDEKINPWWSEMEELRAAIDLSGPEEERNAAYAALRAWVNGSYDAFSTKQNPMILRWETWSPSEREGYLLSLVARSYQFNSRFDHETVLGEQTSAGAEQLWGMYEQVRLAIAEQEATDPAFSSTRAYAALDSWIRQQTAADPVFAAQVAHANTWGWSFEQVLNRRDDTWGFIGAEEARPYWDGLLDAVRQVQGVVERADLHGLEDTATKAIAYRTMIESVRSYVNQLREASPVFRAEWDWLDKENGPDSALEIFIPNTWYRLGGVPE